MHVVRKGKHLRKSRRTILLIQRDPRSQSQRNIRNLVSVMNSIQNVTNAACGKPNTRVWDWARNESSDPLKTQEEV